MNHVAFSSAQGQQQKKKHHNYSLIQSVNRELQNWVKFASNATQMRAEDRQHIRTSAFELGNTKTRKAE